MSVYFNSLLGLRKCGGWHAKHSELKELEGLRSCLRIKVFLIFLFFSPKHGELLFPKFPYLMERSFF
jgi:hypothetical protein